MKLTLNVRKAHMLKTFCMLWNQYCLKYPTGQVWPHSFWEAFDTVMMNQQGWQQWPIYKLASNIPNMWHSQEMKRGCCHMMPLKVRWLGCGIPGSQICCQYLLVKKWSPNIHNNCFQTFRLKKTVPTCESPCKLFQVSFSQSDKSMASQNQSQGNSKQHSCRISF